MYNVNRPKNLGIKTEELAQQELDRSMQDMEIWLQRADMILMQTVKTDDKIYGRAEPTQIDCPECAKPLKIVKQRLTCTNGHCPVISVGALGKIIRATVI